MPSSNFHFSTMSWGLGPTYVLGHRGAKRPCEYLRPPRRNIVVKYAFWASPCSLNQGLLWGCSVLWRAMVLDCVAGSFQVGLRLVNLAIQSILEVKWLRLDNGCCCMVSPCLGSSRHVTIQSLYIECWKATPKQVDVALVYWPPTNFRPLDQLLAFRGNSALHLID